MKKIGTVMAVAVAVVLALWFAWPAFDPGTPLVTPWKKEAGTESGAMLAAARSRELQRAELTEEPRRDAVATKAATDSGSLLVRVAWRDGQPGVGIPVFVCPYREMNKAFARWQAITGANGTARFVDLPPGHHLGETVDQQSPAGTQPLVALPQPRATDRVEHDVDALPLR